MADYELTDEQVRAFWDDGYVIVPGLFSGAEMKVLHDVGKTDRAMVEGALARKDASGGVSKLWLSGELGDDLYSAFCRSPRLVDPLEQLFGQEVVNFHHKMMQKEPRVGGAWEWHQDYGYWYRNEGFLFPDLCSCLIAVDRATQENGCLQVLRGSHKAGRIEHGLTADQVGAQQDRVDALAEELELVYVELEPGDTLFFHSNTLHRSDANRSENPRWSLICCYATAGNRAVGSTDQLRLTPIDRLDDATIREIGERQLASMQAASA